MKRIIWVSGVIVIMIVILFQFRIVIDNPPVTGDFQAPKEVKNIITTSCYDCHSNQTQLSWFNKLPFVNRKVANDIFNARAKINFSEWNKYSEKERKAILLNALTKVKTGIMPLKEYTWIHSKSKLNQEKINTLELYIKKITKTNYTETKEDKQNFKEQYANWDSNRLKTIKVQNAPNGIPFPEEYRNWGVISSSHRIDNESMRIILGNNIAVKASRDKQTNPWPNGTILAKIVWKQGVDENWEGAIVPREFIHAEFMFKDNKKYADTKGWGWARWLGSDLKPFGKDENFTQSCIECHIPVKNRDWVFTTPVILP